MGALEKETQGMFKHHHHHHKWVFKFSTGVQEMSSESHVRIITEHLDEEQVKFWKFLNRLNQVVYIQFLKEYAYQYL